MLLVKRASDRLIFLMFFAFTSKYLEMKLESWRVNELRSNSFKATFF